MIGKIITIVQHCIVCVPQLYTVISTLSVICFVVSFCVGMLNSFFLKFELRSLKFELNSNFVHVPELKLCEISFARYSQHPA